MTGASVEPGPEDARPAVPAAPAVEPFGDAALLVSAADPDRTAYAAWAGAVAAAIQAGRRATPAIGRPVAAHDTILVPFDPLTLELEDAIAIARSAVSGVAAAIGGGPAERRGDRAATDRSIEIAVRYGGADGPDLDDVAATCGLRPADVVELHAGARYRVLFLGFAPGFGYLGGLPAALATPRRTSPRERIPAGSVAIAGEHSAVYPLAMPGGWHLIGRTDAILFDPRADPPALLRPGAAVRFVPTREG